MSREPRITGPRLLGLTVKHRLQCRPPLTRPAGNGSPVLRAPVLLVLVAVLLAGCTAGAPDATDPSPAETAAPTAANGSDSPIIEYVIRPRKLPDEFSSVTMTVRIVFVDQPGDLGPCYPEVFSGPYKPTITPLRTLAGECHRSAPQTIDLVGLTGEVSLENVTVPATAEGHALLVTDLDVTRENGTSVTSIKEIGGAELIRSPTPPDGRYGVEVGIESVTDRRYDYWLVWERFDPGE